jgi:hypothetical protein
LTTQSPHSAAEILGVDCTAIANCEDAEPEKPTLGAKAKVMRKRKA